MMITIEVPAPGSRVARAALALLTVCCSGVGAEVAADAAAERDREQQLIEEIQATLADDGPHSNLLLEPLTALSLLYEETGDHALALVAIERALQVTRVNSGLHTLDQVPLALRKIRHEEARGNDADAWELEQALLKLIRRHPGDLRTAPMLREIADRQMATLAEYLRGEQPPEVLYGCFYKQWPTADGGSCMAGSRKIVVQGMLAEAQRNYADAITVMLSHGLYGSDELREIERELLEGVELIRSLYEGPGEHPMPMVPATINAGHVEPWRSRMAPLIELAAWDIRHPSDAPRDEQALRRAATRHSSFMLTYERGRQSLRRLHAYEVASSAPPLALATALAEIADWDLLYSHNGQALEGYTIAHAMLHAAGVPAGSVAQAFAPATPIVLPTFNGNPLARDETRPATGHIDVTFTLTKYGRAHGVELTAVVDATDAAQQRLVRLIKRSRFRPQLTDGRFADSTRVAFRYHVQD